MANDLEKLQGAWNVVALQTDGRKMPASMVRGARIVIEGERFSTIAMGAAYGGTVSVDEAQVPKAFNLNFTEGPEKGNTSYGIYELDGDTWKICLTITGNQRPREFATKPGSGLALETLERGAAT